MTLKEALLKYGKVRRTYWKDRFGLKNHYITLDNCGVLVDENGNSIIFSKYLFEDDWEEYKEPQEILTEEERDYLKAVIKPFRDRVKTINKVVNVVNGYAITICLESETEGYDYYIHIPFFEKGKRYNGMQFDRKYTLEELGL